MKATRNNPFVRPRRKMVSTWLAAAAIAGAPGTSWSDIIAYNFSENPGNQVLDNTTPKGPTGTSQWNDSNAVDNGGLAAGDEAGLLDDTGAATSASIAWNSSNVWWNGSGTGSEEARLAVGYLDDGGSGVSVTVSNIPYAAYNVYGIVGSGQGDTYTTLDFQVNGTWALGGAAPTTATAFGHWGATSANGVWTEIDPGVTTGNYWKVEGVTGGNLTIQGQPRNGAERGSLVAIIIEEATFSAPSFVDKPGITNLPALALGDGLTSTFRPGLDAVTVTDLDGLSLGAPGETHTLRILPSASTLDGTYTLLDYDGSFGGAGFGGLVLEPIPNPRYTLNLGDNLPNTSVDLVYAGPEPLVWAGGSGAWDTTNTLWNLETGGTPTSFIDLDIVKFPDQGGSPVAVTLDATVSPLSTSFENSADDYVLSGTGAIAGSTGLSISGGGSVTLETANSFTGPISVTGGSTLGANQAGSLGAAGGTLTLDDGTLAPSVGFSSAKVLTIGAGGGTVDVPAAETLAFTASGFKGGNTLVKTGDGILRFAGYNANGFAGDLDIQSGTVEMAGGAFNGNIGLGSITVRSGATLNQPAGAFHALGGYFAPTPAITLEEGATYQIDQENYLSSVTLTGATIQGTGETRADDGFSVEILSSPTLSTWSANLNLVVTNGTFFVEDGPLAVDAVLGGVISNTFGITKQGLGTLEITAPNTYTGTTTIEDGTLLLTGDGTLGDSALIDLFPDTTLDATMTTTILAVGEFQTIAGDGLVLGDVALDGTVSPGASAGVLTFEDVITFYDFSTYTWEVASWATDAIEGLDYDLLVAGTLDIFALESSPITIAIVDDATPDFVEEDRTFVIAQADSILGFDPTLFTIDDSAFKATTGANGTWEIQANGNNLELVYTAQLLSGYALWASQQGFDPGDEIPTADPDGDTVPNGIEFVVGGDPVNGNDLDKLPTMALDPTNLVFTFRQTPESAAQNPFVEYGSDLNGWTTAADGTDGVTITAGTDAPDGTPTVVVTIPRSLATGDKLFARLAFELPVP